MNLEFTDRIKLYEQKIEKYRQKIEEIEGGTRGLYMTGTKLFVYNSADVKDSFSDYKDSTIKEKLQNKSMFVDKDAKVAKSFTSTIFQTGCNITEAINKLIGDTDQNNRDQLKNAIYSNIKSYPTEVPLKVTMTSDITTYQKVADELGSIFNSPTKCKINSYIVIAFGKINNELRAKGNINCPSASVSTESTNPVN